jgi:hypothetical protein
MLLNGKKLFSQLSGLGLVGGAVLMAIHPVPSDSTPLHIVQGEVAISELLRTYHYRSGWQYHNVFHMKSGETLQYHFPPDLHPLPIPDGAQVTAQVDQSGEIWEVRVDDNEILPLSATLQLHREVAKTMRELAVFVLILGLSMIYIWFLPRIGSEEEQ